MNVAAQLCLCAKQIGFASEMPSMYRVICECADEYIFAPTAHERTMNHIMERFLIDYKLNPI